MGMIPTDARSVRAAKVRPLVAYALVAALCAAIVVTSMTARTVMHAVQRPPQAAAPLTIEFGSRLVGRAGDSLGRVPAPALPEPPLAALVAGHGVPVRAAQAPHPRVQRRAHHHGAVRRHPNHHVLTAAPAVHPVRHHAAPVHRLDPQATIKQVVHHVKLTTTQTHHVVRTVVAKTNRTVHKVLAGANKLVKTVRVPHLSLHLLSKQAQSA